MIILEIVYYIISVFNRLSQTLRQLRDLKCSVVFLHTLGFMFDGMKWYLTVAEAITLQ